MLCIAGLQDVTACPAAYRLDHELPVVVGGQHDHADLGMLIPEHAGGLQAVHLGHTDVDQRDIGLLGVDELQELLAVRCFADHVDAVGHVQIAAQPLTNQRMVVGDGDPDRHGLLPRPSGTPRPGRGQS